MTRADILAAHPLPAFLLARGVKLSGNATRADRCPAKQHTRADTVAVDGEKGTWFCHACNVGGSVVDWLAVEKGISPAAAMKELAGTTGNDEHAPTGRPGGKQIVAEYSYTDENGKLLFQCVRFAPKTFRQRRPDPAKPGAWLWNLKDVRLVPYRLPDVVKADTVFICEGEKDCETLARLGFVATCNAMGAGKWRDAYAEHLRGKTVFIIPDRDEPGAMHADRVARSLHRKAASVKVVELPATVNGRAVKDATDFVEAIGDDEAAARELRQLADAAPTWTPKAAPTVEESIEAGDVAAAILAVLTNGDIPAHRKNPAVGALVCGLLGKRGRFYYHATHRDFPTAMYFDATTKRLTRIQSDEFLSWLSKWTGVSRAAGLFRYITAAVETAALSSDATRGIIPETFWASRPGAIYLSNGDGQMAKITAGHVALVDNGTDGILFPAGATLPPWTLTAPADPFATCDLFRDANTIDPHGKTLLKLWFVSLPTNPTCKPPLVMAGQIRSGKTRTARGMAEVFGLVFRTCAPKNGEKALADFWTTLDGGGLFCADNVDSRIDWLPDALAAAATGVGDTRRKLYTDATQVELKPRAWLILTAANPLFASDVGLSDRLLVVRLGQRTGATSDETLSKQIEANRDGALSWLAHTLAGALADTKPTPDGLNARHPDFAAFAVRIGRALGIEGEAVAALRAAETDKARFCLENDPVGAALLSLLADGTTFAGTAADLLTKLAEYDSDFSEETKGARGNPLWTVKRLSKRLGALWPHVEVVAVARRDTDAHSKTAWFSIKPRPASAGFAGIETLNREKSLCKSPTRGFAVSAVEYPQTPQTTSEPEAVSNDTLRV